MSVASRTASATPPVPLALAGVWACAALPFLAAGAVLPVLPRYIRGPVGASDLTVGITVGAFAVTALVVRPYAGRLADRIGRRPVVAIGAALTAVAGLLYFLPAGVPGLLVARLVLGAGEGFVFTAGVAWALDLAPADRRGQVIGLFGLAIWGSLSVGPLAGEGLFRAGGYDAVWAFAAIVPVLGVVLALRLREERTPSGVRSASRLLPPGVLGPGGALALANVGYAAMAAFAVLHLEARGVEPAVGAFTAFAVAVVTVRLVFGRVPDRLGAARTAFAALLIEGAGLAVVALASSLGLAVAGAALIGAGFSVLFPSLALLVIDSTDDSEHGGALGAFTAFFDVGVAVGSAALGAIVALGGYPWAFWAGSACALLGGLIILVRQRAWSRCVQAGAGRKLT